MVTMHHGKEHESALQTFDYLFIGRVTTLPWKLRHGTGYFSLYFDDIQDKRNVTKVGPILLPLWQSHGSGRELVTLRLLSGREDRTHLLFIQSRILHHRTVMYKFRMDLSTAISQPRKSLTGMPRASPQGILDPVEVTVSKELSQAPHRLHHLQGMHDCGKPPAQSIPDRQPEYYTI